MFFIAGQCVIKFWFVPIYCCRVIKHAFNKLLI